MVMPKSSHWNQGNHKENQKKFQVSQARQQGPIMRNLSSQGRYQDPYSRNPNQLMNCASEAKHLGPGQSQEGMRNASRRNQAPKQKWGFARVDPWICQPNSQPPLLPTSGVPLNIEAPHLDNMRQLLPLNANAAGSSPNIPSLQLDTLLQCIQASQGQQFIGSAPCLLNMSAFGHENINQRQNNLAQLNTDLQVNALNNFGNSVDVAGIREELVNVLLHQQYNNQIIQQPLHQETNQNRLKNECLYGNRTEPCGGRSNFSTANTDRYSLPEKDHHENEQTSSENYSESMPNGCSAEFGTNQNFRRTRRRIRGKDKILGGVPSDSVFCHICQKQFEGSQTLIEHLGGRPHREKVRDTESRYIKEQKDLRRNAQYAEQQRQSALRSRGAGQILAQQHRCDVCDLHFVGDLNEHERLESHKSLQLYYKQSCVPCQQHFPNRIKYEEHISSIKHIRFVGLEDYRNQKGGGASKETHDGTNKNTDDDVKENKAELKSESKTAGHSQERHGEENAVTEKLEGAKEEVLKSPTEQTNSTASLSPSITDRPASQGKKSPNCSREHSTKRKLPKKLPPYDPNVEIGRQHLKPVTGWHCAPCCSFLPSEKAVHTHLTSLAHYEKFASLPKKSRWRGSTRPKNGDGGSTSKSLEVEESTMKEGHESNTSVEDHGDRIMRKDHQDNTTNKLPHDCQAIEEDETITESNDTLSKSDFERYLGTKSQLSSTIPFIRTMEEIDADVEEDDAPERDGNWKRQRVSAGREAQPHTSKATRTVASSNEISEDADYIVGSLDEDLLNL